MVKIMKETITSRIDSLFELWRVLNPPRLEIPVFSFPEPRAQTVDSRTGAGTEVIIKIFKVRKHRIDIEPLLVKVLSDECNQFV